MYEDLFKNLPQGFDKKALERNYWIRLSTAIDDAMLQAENGNTAGAIAKLGTVKELSDALFDLRKSVDKE